MFSQDTLDRGDQIHTLEIFKTKLFQGRKRDTSIKYPVGENFTIYGKWLLANMKQYHQDHVE